MQGPKDFAAAFAMIAEERPDALLVLQDAVTIQQRKEIIEFAIQKRLPSMFNEKGWAVAGGLMSYGENLPSMYRRAAYFVDRIFKGAKPTDLPVEQATKFDMVLNLRTAKAIGVDDSGFDPCPRRRGDRIGCPLLRCYDFEIGTLRPSMHGNRFGRNRRHSGYPGKPSGALLCRDCRVARRNFTPARSQNRT